MDCWIFLQLGLFPPSLFAHVDGDVDAEVAVVGEELRDVGVEHKAVWRVDGGLYPVVDGARGGFPRQAPPVPIQLQPATTQLVDCCNIQP